ncbi:MAG: hypothetical protein C0183_10010, partial [Roseiflexus castenholzii]
GDGTIAEAVNHMRLDRQHLLVLPGGTGNGLDRDLGIASVDHALAARRADRRHTIDLLQVTFDTPYETHLPSDGQHPVTGVCRRHGCTGRTAAAGACLTPLYQRLNHADHTDAAPDPGRRNRRDAAEGAPHQFDDQ